VAVDVVTSRAGGVVPVPVTASGAAATSVMVRGMAARRLVVSSHPLSDAYDPHRHRAGGRHEEAKMSNPVLTRGFTVDEQRAGWAAADTVAAQSGLDAVMAGPVTTGRVMTMGNTVLAIGVCFVLLVGAGAVGWTIPESNPAGDLTLPWWLILLPLAGLGLVLLGLFRPRTSPIVAPVYSLMLGVFLGAVSKVYENQWDGVVVQAILATACVFLVVLALYALRVVKVTNRFIMGVAAATLGLVLLYAVGLLLNLFGIRLSFLYGSGPGAILISVVAVIVASLNLFIDFAVVERGVEARAPAYYEWYAAMGLMVTVVWLYLEMLRLLARLRG
jgi:uncharacterized YccA/Bax inhibitor family protein